MREALTRQEYEGQYPESKDLFVPSITKEITLPEKSPRKMEKRSACPPVIRRRTHEVMLIPVEDPDRLFWTLPGGYLSLSIVDTASIQDGLSLSWCLRLIDAGPKHSMVFQGTEEHVRDLFKMLCGCGTLRLQDFLSMGFVGD